MKRAATAIVACAVLVAGCDDRLDLIVDVRTDLVPGAELAGLSAELDGEAPSGAEVTGERDWLAGGRVAELRAAPGTHTVIIRGESPDGRELVTRRVAVTLDQDTAITVLLTRDCRGVVCGAAGAGACWAGRCVAEDCVDEQLVLCGDPECADASECPPAGPCGASRCELGACVYEAMGACSASEYCDPEFGCRSAGDTGPADGLIAHWRFDDDPNDGSVDSAGSHHGSCTECPSLVSGGPRESFYEATSGDRQVIVPADSTIEGVTAFTLAGWIRIEGPSRSFRSFFAKPFGASTANSWELNLVDEVPRFNTQSSDTSDTIPAIAAVPFGVWTHIAATFDGTTKRFYVDGALQGMSTIMPIVYDGQPVSLMADLNSGAFSSPIRGAVDDLRMYARALTDAEVADLATP